MAYLGSTDHGEDVEINRRAAESDLLVYVNINLVPMDGGHKSVTVGLCDYLSLRPHHEPQTIVDSESYMDPPRSELDRKCRRMGALVDQHLGQVDRDNKVDLGEEGPCGASCLGVVQRPGRRGRRQAGRRVVWCVTPSRAGSGRVRAGFDQVRVARVKPTQNPNSTNHQRRPTRRTSTSRLARSASAVPPAVSQARTIAANSGLAPPTRDSTRLRPDHTELSERSTGTHHR
jgi:hypothetical protein